MFSKKSSIWVYRLYLDNSFSFLVLSTLKKIYFSALAFFGLAQLGFSNLFSWNLISDFFILFLVEAFQNVNFPQHTPRLAV